MITAIVLASGYSSRMGKNKLLLLKDGIPMIEHIFQQLCKINFHEVIVVTQYEKIKTLAKLYGYKTIINNESQIGISKSIELGVNNTNLNSNFMFFTGDQPFLTSKVIEKIIQISDTQHIVVPRFLGVNKSPVIFGYIYKKELLKLNGDVGGKEVIKNNLNSVKYIEFSKGHDFLDIDTKKEYEKIIFYSKISNSLNDNMT